MFEVINEVIVTTLAADATEADEALLACYSVQYHPNGQSLRGIDLHGRLLPEAAYKADDIEKQFPMFPNRLNGDFVLTQLTTHEELPSVIVFRHSATGREVIADSESLGNMRTREQHEIKQAAKSGCYIVKVDKAFKTLSRLFLMMDFADAYALSLTDFPDTVKPIPQSDNESDSDESEPDIPPEVLAQMSDDEPDVESVETDSDV